jgi:hypothetical protein
MLTVTGLPWVMPVRGLRVRFVMLGLNVTLLHWFTRLLTCTEPRPVARSYPTPLLNWGLVVKLASPGTALLPTVTSLNTQVLAGEVAVPEALHCARLSAAASLYKT